MNKDLAARIASLSPQKQALLLQRLAAIDTAPVVTQTEQGILSGLVPISPQTAEVGSFFADPYDPDNNDPFHWAIMVRLFDVSSSLNPELLKRAVQYLHLHHDALRLRFQFDFSGCRQFIAEPDEFVPFSYIDLSGLSEVEQCNAIELEILTLRSRLHITKGPLIWVAYFFLDASQPARLIYLIHHMINDAYSMRILLDDLFAAYDQLNRGQPMPLLPKTASYKQWAEYMYAYVHSETAKREIDYWRALSWTKKELPLDYVPHANTPAVPGILKSELSIEETQALLRVVPRLDDVEIMDILLTALLLAFHKWTGEPVLKLAPWTHGRDLPELDLSRTVGFIATAAPMLLQMPESAFPDDVLRSVKEQRRKLPNDVITVKWLLQHGQEVVANFPHYSLETQITFHYMGKFGDAHVARESLIRGRNEHKNAPREFTYTFPRLMPYRSYKVRLHFIESLYDDVAEREFDVLIGERQMLTKFDIFREAGAKHRVIIKEFSAVTTADGTIAIKFVPLIRSATVSAIEILFDDDLDMQTPTAISATEVAGEVSSSEGVVQRAIYRVNAGGSTVGSFLHDAFVVGGQSSFLGRPYNPWRPMVDISRLVDPAPLDVYWTTREITIRSSPVLFDCNVMIYRDQCVVRLNYDQNLYKHTTVEHIAAEYMAALRALIRLS